MDSSIGPPEVGQSLAQFFFLGKKIIFFKKKHCTVYLPCGNGLKSSWTPALPG
jgi:hypothetical protein